MSEREPPRTRLAQLLRQQHITLEEFRKNYQRAAKGTELSQRQAYRWVTGELRGLQALITYRSGRLAESVRYAQSGAEAAARSHGTAGVWLAGNEARALAALNRFDDAYAALARAADARDQVKPDELDSLGGVWTFSRPRQLYYAADALSWGGQAEAHRTERLVLDALDAYAGAPAQDRAFGGVAGTRSARGIARVYRGEIDGATEALAPVLELPPTQRIHGIVTSVEHVRTALRSVDNPSREVTELADTIENWTAQRLTPPP